MDDLRLEIARSATAGRLRCATAFRLAGRFGRAPGEIRAEADRAGVRISCCQLGLFGTEEFGDPRYARAHALSTCPPELADALRDASTDGRLPCRAAWEIADAQGVPRLLAGCVAEGLGLSIGPCQLGCF